MVSYGGPLMQRRVGSAKNVSEKVLDSTTVLFINQRRKPTKISTGDKSMPAFPLHENRRSKRIVLKKGASLVVDLDRISEKASLPRWLATGVQTNGDFPPATQLNC